MIIGCPKEIKNHEYRVGLTPEGVEELIFNGHEVFVEKDAGQHAGFTDKMYREAGAKISNNAKELFATSELIIKVKEPLASERKMLKNDQILFTYLHLAPDPEQIQDLLKSKCTAIAYETVTDHNGKTPLLMPMSEVAGRLSIQMGMTALETSKQGSGILISGVPGVEPGNVVILGGGNVGENAAKIAMGVGAKVWIVDNWQPRLKELDSLYGAKLTTIKANKAIINKLVSQADIVVGAALVTGAKAPKLITKKMLKTMKKGSVIVDVSIDQGGCFETSRPTTHDKPTYIVDGIIHYCVTNMPGVVAKTSTVTLTNATLPILIQLANKGWKKASKENVHIKNGVNLSNGFVTHEEIHNAQRKFAYKPIDEILKT